MKKSLLFLMIVSSILNAGFGQSKPTPAHDLDKEDIPGVPNWFSQNFVVTHSEAKHYYYDAFHSNIQKGDFGAVSFACEQKKEFINKPDENGNSPLYLAISSNQEEIATYLQSKGAELTPQETEDGS